MHKYSGVILDFYDDKGATLKAKFPTVAELPDTIKTASILPREELPNEAFALIAVDGPDVLRKFACHDAGTTAMSVIYLMEHGHKLPEEAVKVAAAGLVEACLEHGMMPPAALTKVASGEWVARNLPTFSAAGRKALHLAGAPFRAAKEKAVQTAHEMGSAAVRGAREEASKANTSKVVQDTVHDAIHAAKTELSKPEVRQAVKNIGEDLGTGGSSGSKLRNIAILAGVAGTTGAIGVGAGKYLSEKAKSTGEGVAKNVADITGMSSPSRGKSKRASHHMYQDKFPIDSWGQIKKAEAYLLENDCRLDPAVRRECAVKLAARAVDVGYPIHGDILEHGAYGFAPPGEMMAAIEMRKVAGADVGLLYGLMAKKASLTPSTYAECVRRFDIVNGLDGAWDSRIPDPWRSTFGLDKTAAVVWEDGADRVDEGQLENLATNGKQALLGNFSQAFVHEFCQDPAGIFSSMPTPEKRLLSRLASDISSDGRSEGQPR